MQLKSTLDFSAEKIYRWRTDPVFFAVDELGMNPDPWQVHVLRTFGDPEKRRIAMKASKGVGKSAALAVCILNFMVCYGDNHEHPKGAATSITEDNIDDNLWPEIAKWQNRSEALKKAFKWTKSRYFSVDHPETWFFSKRTWPKGGDASQQANTLAGLHSKYLLYVLDESGGIPDAVMSAAQGGLTGSESDRFQKIIQAGNPTHLSGPLYRAAVTDKYMWSLITINGDPDDVNRSSRVSREWAQDQIKQYGRDSPWVLVNVFGEFPPASLNALLGIDDIERSIARNYTLEAYIGAQKRIGVDVARFGDDRTILFPRQGLKCFAYVEMRNARTTEIADRVIHSKNKWKCEMEFVDGTGGYGGGVVDAMIQRGYSPQEINFAGAAMDPRFANKRAEIWWNGSEWIKKRGQLISDENLKRELLAATYTFDSKGRILIEPKELIKQRIGSSPDLADALMLTFSMPEMEGLKIDGRGERIPEPTNQLAHEWDPYAEER